MFIVADKKRKEEYLKKLNYSSFKCLIEKKRVKFMDFESLNRQYELLIEQQKFEFLI